MVVSRLGFEPRTLALKGQTNNALFLLISQDLQCLFRQLSELPRTAKNSQEIILFELSMAASVHTYIHRVSLPRTPLPLLAPSSMRVSASFVAWTAHIIYRFFITLRPRRPAVLVARQPCGPATGHTRPAAPPTHRHGLRVFTPSQPSNRRAISGEIAARPFNTRDNAARVTPNCARGLRHVQAQRQAEYPLATFRLGAAAYASGSCGLPP
jgi:hypothetical protein